MRRIIFGIIFVISCAALPWLVLSPAINLPASFPLRLGIFCLLAVGGSFLFRLAWPEPGLGFALLVTTLTYGAAYKLASFIPDISTYPFSLSWSEASRYYYASLWLSRQVYGQLIPPSILHPSRYLLQAIPFIFPGSSLWLSRLWQVMLWVITASATSWMLVRRLALPALKKSLVIGAAMVLWAFLFLFQGPVYYHLLLMVILILWGFDRTRFWRTLVVVLVASLWAGISRVNWLPVPGLLACALYLLEVNLGDKRPWRYLLPPAVWVLAGTLVSYASQQAYQLWSGNPPAWFGSSFSSNLLWYRLLPNTTYPLGILPSAILVSLPLLGLIVLRLIKRWREYHLIRLAGLAAILCVLFTGGVIVSVKIGGGSNLHNLDAYLSLLLVIGSYIFFERFVSDKSAEPAGTFLEQKTAAPGSQSRWIERVLVAAALVIPISFALSTGSPLPRHDFPSAQAAIQTINTSTQQAASDGGEVLFISQRQLLTFDYVKNVHLIPDDELVFLMEMAMSENAAYMDAFHAAISQQRYALIVSEPLVIQFQGRSHSFGEENDAWVRGVSEPVLCYYQPSVNLNSVDLVLYTPRQDPCQ